MEEVWFSIVTIDFEYLLGIGEDFEFFFETKLQEIIYNMRGTNMKRMYKVCS